MAKVLNVASFEDSVKELVAKKKTGEAQMSYIDKLKRDVALQQGRFKSKLFSSWFSSIPSS